MTEIHKLKTNRGQSLTIHSAVAEDLTDIVTIYNQAIITKTATAELMPVTVADKQTWFDYHLQNSNRPIYVIKNKTSQDNLNSEKHKVVAWGCFSDLYPREAYQVSTEISIYIDNAYQGQGIGKQFTRWMLTQTRFLAVDNVLAKVFAHNQASLAIFKTLGFKQWGFLPKVCDMKGFYADVIILGRLVNSANIPTEKTTEN